MRIRQLLGRAVVIAATGVLAKAAFAAVPVRYHVPKRLTERHLVTLLNTQMAVDHPEVRVMIEELLYWRSWERGWRPLNYG